MDSEIERLRAQLRTLQEKSAKEQRVNRELALRLQAAKEEAAAATASAAAAAASAAAAATATATTVTPAPSSVAAASTVSDGMVKRTSAARPSATGAPFSLDAGADWSKYKNVLERHVTELQRAEADAACMRRVLAALAAGKALHDALRWEFTCNTATDSMASFVRDLGLEAALQPLPQLRLHAVPLVDVFLIAGADPAAVIDTLRAHYEHVQTETKRVSVRVMRESRRLQRAHVKAAIQNSRAARTARPSPAAPSSTHASSTPAFVGTNGVPASDAATPPHDDVVPPVSEDAGPSSTTASHAARERRASASRPVRLSEAGEVVGENSEGALPARGQGARIEDDILYAQEEAEPESGAPGAEEGGAPTDADESATSAARRRAVTSVRLLDAPELAALTASTAPLEHCEPQVLYQYPSNVPLPAAMLPDFCFPQGVPIRPLPANYTAAEAPDIIFGKHGMRRGPRSHVFLLTGADTDDAELSVVASAAAARGQPIEARTRYCVCLQAAEPVSRSLIEAYGARATFRTGIVKRSNIKPEDDYAVLVPRVFCIVSRYPFFALFFEILRAAVALWRANLLHQLREFHEQGFADALLRGTEALATPSRAIATPTAPPTPEKTAFSAVSHASVPTAEATASAATAGGLGGRATGTAVGDTDPLGVQPMQSIEAIAAIANDADPVEDAGRTAASAPVPAPAPAPAPAEATDEAAAHAVTANAPAASSAAPTTVPAPEAVAVAATATAVATAATTAPRDDEDTTVKPMVLTSEAGALGQTSPPASESATGAPLAAHAATPASASPLAPAAPASSGGASAVSSKWRSAIKSLMSPSAAAGASTPTAAAASPASGGAGSSLLAAFSPTAARAKGATAAPAAVGAQRGPMGRGQPIPVPGAPGTPLADAQPHAHAATASSGVPSGVTSMSSTSSSSVQPQPQPQSQSQQGELGSGLSALWKDLTKSVAQLKTQPSGTPTASPLPGTSTGSVGGGGSGSTEHVMSSSGGSVLTSPRLAGMIERQTSSRSARGSSHRSGGGAGGGLSFLSTLSTSEDSSPALSTLATGTPSAPLTSRSMAQSLSQFFGGMARKVSAADSAGEAALDELDEGDTSASDADEYLRVSPTRDRVLTEDLAAAAVAAMSTSTISQNVVQFVAQVAALPVPQPTAIATLPLSRDATPPAVGGAGLLDMSPKDLGADVASAICFQRNLPTCVLLRVPAGSGTDGTRTPSAATTPTSAAAATAAAAGAGAGALPSLPGFNVTTDAVCNALEQDFEELAVSRDDYFGVASRVPRVLLALVNDHWTAWDAQDAEAEESDEELSGGAARRAGRGLRQRQASGDSTKSGSSSASSPALSPASGSSTPALAAKKVVRIPRWRLGCDLDHPETFLHVSQWAAPLLFSILPIDSIMLLVGAALTEQKIVFVGGQMSQEVVTCCVIAFASLLRPLSWVGPFLPMLPNKLLDILSAPIPVLLGVPDLPEDYEQDEQTVLVLLDRETVRIPAVRSTTDGDATVHLLPGFLEIQLPDNSILYHRLEPVARLLRVGSGSGSGSQLARQRVRPCYRPTSAQLAASATLSSAITQHIKRLLLRVFTAGCVSPVDAGSAAFTFAPTPHAAATFVNAPQADMATADLRKLPAFATCAAAMLERVPEVEVPFWSRFLSYQMLSFFYESRMSYLQTRAALILNVARAQPQHAAAAAAAPEADEPRGAHDAVAARAPAVVTIQLHEGDEAPAPQQAALISPPRSGVSAMRRASAAIDLRNITLGPAQFSNALASAAEARAPLPYASMTLPMPGAAGAHARRRSYAWQPSAPALANATVAIRSRAGSAMMPLGEEAAAIGVVAEEAGGGEGGGGASHAPATHTPSSGGSAALGMLSPGIGARHTRRHTAAFVPDVSGGGGGSGGVRSIVGSGGGHHAPHAAAPALPPKPVFPGARRPITSAFAPSALSVTMESGVESDDDSDADVILPTAVAPPPGRAHARSSTTGMITADAPVADAVLDTDAALASMLHEAALTAPPAPHKAAPPAPPSANRQAPAPPTRYTRHSAGSAGGSSGSSAPPRPSA